MTAFADRLAAAVTDRGSSLIVGLDPTLDRLPSELADAALLADPTDREGAARAIVAFNAAVLDATAPFAAGIKLQSACYERWGPPGVAAYEATVARAKDAGLIVIGDVKRGDISSTAAAYAEAHLGSTDGVPKADAVTLNPYLGSDSIRPWLEVAAREEAGAFVLVRTSNPSASELQELSVDGTPLFEHVARRVAAWGADAVGEHGLSDVGAVVGATAPGALARLRELMPSAWFLVPGVGAQGGTAADVAPAFDERGLGAVVNASRSILYAFGDRDRPDWRAPIGDAARRLRDELREAATPAVR